jgi:hypothetical protein
MSAPAVSPRAMTKSPLALAAEALRLAARTLPAYSHLCSPRKFTQPQLFAMLVVRQFFDLDYRGTEQLFRDWSDLRRVLDLKSVPDHSTLEKAEKRLLKKGASTGSSTSSWTRPASVA